MRWFGWRTREAQRANASGIQALHLGHHERAEMLFRYAVELVPGFFGAWVNLGNAVGNQGRHREAIRHYHHAHILAPLDPMARVNAAYAHLMLGEYREGWSLYEERWRDGSFAARTGIDADGNKRWDGRSHPGATLLVFNEQGAGDVIMMLRYVGMLERTGMRVILRVPASLYRLVRENRGGCEVVTNAERLPAHDYHAPFMSLPFLLGTVTPDAIPNQRAYLTADAHSDIAALPGYRVGVVWAGNPKHPADARRSIPLQQMLSLKEMTGVSWVSLQVGDRARDICSFTFDFPMYEPQSFDFADTASVIAGLDCVVAVDTATAHLAGALGVPVLMMLAKENDWRWGVEGERTPWYQRMTLLRQTHSGDWGPVVQQARYLLTQMAQQRRAA